MPKVSWTAPYRDFGDEELKLLYDNCFANIEKGHAFGTYEVTDPDRPACIALPMFTREKTSDVPGSCS